MLLQKRWIWKSGHAALQVHLIVSIYPSSSQHPVPIASRLRKTSRIHISLYTTPLDTHTHISFSHTHTLSLSLCVYISKTHTRMHHPHS
ncbi:hypothetical protein BDB00DRAFT_180654 [Zychaea mexicana]|uniref:uncharacterized protein n=1 Tax=Zychaea mexicana TaxID=64656 RepID=UPI0022FEE6DF|nr:uncharacterized protein BDB00DRAFT_180654 [Zychaea mexicana]KAI9496010.1 hypothetical protein BDB00DRAFT_180654 [Zychaea mexicana]